MSITLEQKGKATIQIAIFDKKIATKNQKPYIALDWCGVTFRAARLDAGGVLYNIVCQDHPLKEDQEYRGKAIRFNWKCQYDMAQKLEDLFHDFLEDNPEAKVAYRTVQYSFHQWELKQRRGEMRGWQDHILPPTMM